MTTEDAGSFWQTVDKLFQRALDLGPAERKVFLEDLGTGNPELRRELEELLDAAEAAEGFMETPLEVAAELDWETLQHQNAADGSEDLESFVGTTVGAYRLTGVLGVGGMGTVFSAERADRAFQRTVAVKILKRSLNAPGMADRFRRERQILASLDHPAIAQMLDGGVSEDGRPYLVMEYIEGVPIDAYADERELGVDERIRLILRVAEAVDYAHRHMVVHRDLKPTNILVRTDGTVKLLDFGIAKMLESPDEDGVATATRAGSRFVTPAYAAPEQLLGEPVSAQTDVYSLAALLYEMLTATRPYESGIDDSVLERVVGGAEPTAPSAVLPPADLSTEGFVRSSSARAAQVYAARGTTPDALRRRLSGDLDAILVRGLRARPTERYPSVRALSDDLERHLTGQAVTARGDALVYRARKFVRRRRLPLAVAAGIFLLTAGSAAGLAVQRGTLIEERNRAEAATRVAGEEAETARQVTAFLVELFEGSDPSERLGDTITARALLERGNARIERELSGQPVVKAELLGALGDVYLSLGSYDRGIALLERAASIRRDSIEDRRGLSAALRSLAAAHGQAGQHALARASYGEALVSAVAANDTLEIAYARLGIGQSLKFLDRPDSAVVELNRSLATMRRLAVDEEVILTATGDLAGILRRQGDLSGADSLYTSVLEGRRVRGEADPILFAVSLNDLGVVRRMRGRFDDASALYEEALDTLTMVLGPAHPRTLAIRGNLATTLMEAHRWNDAVAVQRGSVAAARGAWPEGHWRTGNHLMQLGATLIGADRADEAIEPLQEALDVTMEQLGAYHSWSDICRAWLGTAAALAGRRDAADQLFQWSITGLSAYAGLAEDGQVKGMLRGVVEMMEKKGLFGDAERFRELSDPESGSG